MKDKAVDALLWAAIKAIGELEGMLALLDRAGIVKKLREVLDLLDSLPTIENDLAIVKNRLRQMLSSDPDKTPKAISIKDMEAVEPRPTTMKGLSVAPPLPKKRHE